MSKLFALWAYLKTNLALIGVFLGVLMFLTFVAYLQGRTDGKTACEAKYEAEKAKGYAAITQQLQEINKQDAERQKLWEKQNQATNEALERRVENTYRVVEKIIEKPVEVQGDCRISYDVVGLLNDAASPAGN